MTLGVAEHVISLQPPRDESLNGLLQGYRIYYRELESEAGTSPEAKMLKSPSALRAELTGEPFTHTWDLPTLGRGFSVTFYHWAWRGHRPMQLPRSHSLQW